MKPLKDYIKEDEHGIQRYEDEDGVEYRDLTSLLQSHALGFCGCGDPETVLNLIHGLIKLKQKRCADTANISDAWFEYRYGMKAYLIENIDAVMWFFDYLLDEKEITTHGGNVSGSWIDDHNFVAALEVWAKEQEAKKE